MSGREQNDASRASRDLIVDVVVLGSGFAGSLAALLLAKEGHLVALVEQGKHPRFAIGESSTPLADFKLQEIAKRYDLPRLEPFAQYGSWTDSYPQVMRGVKRGFAYFSHREGQPFVTDKDHCNELLVTANSSRHTADTHWLRSDVDAWFVDEAVRAGVIFLDETSIDGSVLSENHHLVGIRAGEGITIASRFLIIATGNPQLWNKAIPIGSTGKLPRTSSRTIFAHFANVKPWRESMSDSGYSTADHPFDCDQAALHHVFAGGWMWQLRFDDQTTSAGFLIDNHQHPITSKLSVTEEWQGWLSRFPSIQQQFEGATIVRPQAGLQRADRLQQELRQVVGTNWALLPAAVGFSDPLFSTGIGHALFSVDRLVMALRKLDRPDELVESLDNYSQRMLKEIDLIDRFVSLAYRASSSFKQYVIAAMPYFAAATTCEQTARNSNQQNSPAFLLADDVAFLEAMRRVEQSHATLADTNGLAESESGFEQTVREVLTPFNHVGLLSPEKPGMYRYTAAK